MKTTIKKRKGNHKVATYLLPNFIVYYIIKIYKDLTDLDQRDIQGLVLMLLLWGMGLGTGFIWALLKCKY